MTNSCNCPTGSYGQKHTAECYEDRLTQLRGNLSLAEEGLASATQELVRLQAEIRALDQANGQAVRENERLRAASALLVNAVEDTLRSHPEELSCCTVTRIRCAAMREMLADPWEAKMLGKALIPLAPSHEPNLQPSALERAFSENVPIVEAALQKIGSQLGDDLMIFGSAFARRNPDGSIERVDPKDVCIKPAEKSGRES